jgi:hypothetical protein
MAWHGMVWYGMVCDVMVCDVMVCDAYELRSEEQLGEHQLTEGGAELAAVGLLALREQQALVCAQCHARVWRDTLAASG